MFWCRDPSRRHNVGPTNHVWHLSGDVKSMKKFKCDKRKRDTILEFSTPTGWRQPQTREDCYFCMTVVCGFAAKTKSKINYASVPSMTKPVLKLHVNAPDEE